MLSPGISAVPGMMTVIAEGAEDVNESWEGCDVRYVSDPIVRELQLSVQPHL